MSGSARVTRRDAPVGVRAHVPLLLDEPFAALDALTRQRQQEDVRTISHESGRTSVFVTHSADEGPSAATPAALPRSAA